MVPALVLLLVVNVSAAEGRDARALVTRSILEFNSAQFEAALADIKKAYLLDPRPGLLFNLAQCERAMHHWELARFAYQRYLSALPNAPNRAVVQGLIAEMQTALRSEAAAKAQAPPAPSILVEAAPAKAAPEAAPSAAVEASASPAEEQPHHSHALAITLGAVGLVAAGVGVYGGVDLVSYNSAVSATHSGTTYFTPQLQSAQSQAAFWAVAWIPFVVAGAVGLGAGAFTW